jgi:hypothetical protein
MLESIAAYNYWGEGHSLSAIHETSVLRTLVRRNLEVEKEELYLTDSSKWLVTMTARILSI